MTKPSKVNWHTTAGDGLLGERIVLRARKPGRWMLVQSSGKHRTNETCGTEKAEAWIEIPKRAIAERRDNK